jgi:hypothetical protein
VGLIPLIYLTKSIKNECSFKRPNNRMSMHESKAPNLSIVPSSWSISGGPDKMEQAGWPPALGQWPGRSMGLGGMCPRQARPVAGGHAVAGEWAGRTRPRSRSGGCRRLTREEKGIETCVRTEQEQRPESRPAAGVRELYGQRPVGGDGNRAG